MTKFQEHRQKLLTDFCVWVDVLGVHYVMNNLKENFPSVWKRMALYFKEIEEQKEKEKLPKLLRK